MTGTSTGTSSNIFKVSSIRGGIVLQLLFTHSLIAIVTIVNGTAVVPIIFACLLSFLLLLNIPYNLRLLEMTLDRLVRGLSIEPFSLNLRWPLAPLFLLVQTLSQQTGQQIQREERNVAYRDQLLQQVGKTAAQEERNRLARDLHDSIKQQLFSIAVSAAAVKARWELDIAAAHKIVDDIERTALEAQVEMQALLQQLRPTALENVGLIESLRVQCQALGYRTGAEVTTELNDLPPDALLPIGAQEMIFRITQEGFANIARHARASHIWLSLRQQRDALLVEIGDDGQGFDLAQIPEQSQTYGGMGLINVHERIRTLGGTLTVWSQPGKGTTLHLCIPLMPSDHQIHAQEQANQECIRAIRKIRRIQRIGTRTAELAAACILLAIPAFLAQWAVFICIGITCISWLWAQQYRVQLALDFGRRYPRHFALLAESYALLSSMILLCMLFPNYFSAFRYYTTMPDSMWLVVAIYISLTISVIVTCLRSFQNADRYVTLLSGAALFAEMRRQIRQNVIDWTAWIIVFALTLLQLNLTPNFLVDAVAQRMAYVLLSVWFIFLGLKTIHIARWQYRLHKVTDIGITEKGTSND